MKNENAFKTAILNAAELVKQGRLDEVLLEVAESGLNEDGKLYDLWCDGCGSECGTEEICSDEAELACIRRFLDREVPND